MTSVPVLSPSIRIPTRMDCVSGAIVTELVRQSASVQMSLRNRNFIFRPIGIRVSNTISHAASAIFHQGGPFFRQKSTLLRFSAGNHQQVEQFPSAAVYLPRRRNRTAIRKGHGLFSPETGFQYFAENSLRARSFPFRNFRFRSGKEISLIWKPREAATTAVLP